MKSVLSYLLVASLGANAYLWWQLQNTTQNDNKSNTAHQPVENAQQNTSATDFVKFNDSQSTNAKVERLGDSNIIAAPSAEGVNLAFLKQLRDAKEYESLSFHVRSYLRQHPQDTEALLLEAQAYYFTQPLNTALVNYYGLRDALLSAEQLDEVNRIIDVNTTRIIQQFSGDGSWDLLASFLEPLLQVDPLNRRYIMALAKAYGMQEQTVLMENVLAALPSYDVRAQRLRDSIYKEQVETAPSELTSTAIVPEQTSAGRNKEVKLTERKGQYYTQVRLTDVSANLLVDTGASTTAISQEVFQDIASEDSAYLGTFNVQTAGGSISSPLYRISEMTVGSETINNVSVLVLPSDNMRDFDGLLGMNVIKRFNIAYDQSLGMMRMYKK